tara:strand:- start:516 stop:1568 length:1053 start_codon:yes stop_codon:yes gene_type:complete
MSSSPKNILILKLGSLGDIVHALPVARTLRTNFPEARISWLVEDGAKDILYQNPDLDELIVVRLKYWRKNLNQSSFHEAGTAVRELRSKKFDTVLDLQGLIKSGVLSALSGSPRRIGFHRKDCREWLNVFFTNDRASYLGNNNHIVEKNLALLKQLGISNYNYEFPISVQEESEEYIEKFFLSHPQINEKFIVAVNPGAGFISKRWSLKRFSKVADRISSELDCNILLTWGPGEEDQIEAISNNMTQPHWIAPTTTVQQSLALYKRLKLFIGCDTGPLHLCSALETPTISIFGPTDPARNGAYGKGHQAMFKVLPCSFCHKRVCPTQNECMDAVQPDEVFEAARKSLYNL